MRIYSPFNEIFPQPKRVNTFELELLQISPELRIIKP
jgi:hypothetical protein